MWRPIETAPKGSWAKLVTDPEWAEPPKILMLFENREQVVCHWDWYYSEKGRGYNDGVSAWVEPISGEQIALHYDEPIAWQPLPELPK